MEKHSNSHVTRLFPSSIKNFLKSQVGQESLASVHLANFGALGTEKVKAPLSPLVFPGPGTPLLQLPRTPCSLALLLPPSKGLDGSTVSAPQQADWRTCS